MSELTRNWLALRVLAIALFFPGAVFGQDMQAINPNMPPKMKIDENRIKTAGISLLQGKHIALYTDTPDHPDIVEFVDVFDQATEQWCEYFEIDKTKAEPWKITVIIIGAPFAFSSAKLVPRDLPKFEAGINRGHEIWMRPQQGDYYTRHLLLHEGTHAFMQWFLGDSGPPWYSEGMAELLALHQWKDGKLQLNYRATSAEETAFWGRPKKIKELREQNEIKSLEDIMAVEAIYAKQVDNYAWSWAACEFFKHHPLTATPFKELALDCKDRSPRFSLRFLTRIKKHKAQVDRDWHVFVKEFDYGIRSSDLSISEAVDEGKNIFEVASNRYWQKTNIKVKKGDKLTVSTQGKYQVRETTKPWMTESNGITIEYHDGRPLGMLLMGILQEESSEGLLSPVGISNRKRCDAAHDGILCFRVNEASNELADNVGNLKVHIKKH